jgi:hypothetical protein
MQCISCQEEVSERFVSALAKNLCPFCGQGLMPPELQTLLNGLAAIMCDLETKSYLGEAEGWLKQNFDLISMASDEYVALTASLEASNEKVASLQAELVEANKKVEAGQKKSPLSMRNPKPLLDTDGNPIKIDGEIVQVEDQSVTNSFMKRAEVGKLVAKTEELKKVAAKIRAAGGKGNSLTIPVEDVVEDASYDPYEAEDSYDEPLDPIAERLAAMGSGGGNTQGGYNPRDVAKLQNLQAKQKAASRAMAGGSAGMFHRSS